LDGTCFSIAFRRMSLKAVHMLSIVRKDTAMKSFNFVSTSVQKTPRKAYSNYIHDIISPDQTGNPKRFWSFIKAKKQENSGVAPLRG
jgi:hypothetical protein